MRTSSSSSVRYGSLLSISLPLSEALRSNACFMPSHVESTEPVRTQHQAKHLRPPSLAFVADQTRRIVSSNSAILTPNSLYCGWAARHQDPSLPLARLASTSSSRFRQFGFARAAYQSLTRSATSKGCEEAYRPSSSTTGYIQPSCCALS